MTGHRPLLLLATGDVAPRRGDMSSMFQGIGEVLRRGDFVFGQLEAPVSSRGAPSPNAKLAMRTRPEAAPAIAAAGYTVMSAAGNHCMDWGREALLDTVAHMHGAGVALCGAGANLAAARRPAIVERDGVKLAVLAYNSILPEGYRAERTRPGCAPLRAHTLYEQVEPDQPGTPPRVLTFPHPGDLEQVLEDVREAKAKADIVAVSFHWGIHFVPAVLADYQRTVAHATIDAGADIILGHHPHILKGIEVYRGKAIFYSLGNFAIEDPWAFDQTIQDSEGFATISALNPGMTAKSLPQESRWTMVVRARITDRAITAVSFQPAIIDSDTAPRAAPPGSEAFRLVVDYVDEITRSQKLPVRFTTQGDEVLVESP